MHQLCPLKCVWKLNVQKMKTQVSYTSKNTKKVRFVVTRGRNQVGETEWRQLKVQTSSYRILTTRDVMHSLINVINTAICHRRRQWQPTPVLLPGKSHGQRSLVGFSPWGHGESDTTERLHFHLEHWSGLSFPFPGDLPSPGLEPMSPALETDSVPPEPPGKSVGEGNGNPLQCSCLENPRDGGVWWAAIYGVAQSQTWLKRLSSSSSKVCPDMSHYFLRGKVTPAWEPLD